MDVTLQGETVSWAKPLGSGEQIGFEASNIRRERTGVHAKIAIIGPSGPLASDNFNIERSEERRRLAKAAFEGFGPMYSENYTAKMVELDLLDFTEAATEAWEEGRIQEDLFDADEETPDLQFILRPYIIQGGSTLLFGPPGSGKSYLALLIGVSIGAGKKDFWRVKQSPVCYVNLERSRESMRRRLSAICGVLGVRGRDHQVTLMNCRGLTLPAIARKVKAYQRTYRDALIIVDSISRAGVGSLVEDVTANRIIDILNAFPTWLAIGHTPRDDPSHEYGSVMFGAGEDVGIQLAAEKRGNVLGLSMIVRKANDIAFPPPPYFAFEFTPADEESEGRLFAIRTAQASEFPQLATAIKPSLEHTVLAYLKEHGPSTATEISKDNPRLQRSNIAAFLSISDLVARGQKRGREVPYSLASNLEPDVY